ncbi:hypothetical protein NGTWS0302_16680 [Mycolicibacterium cyprinidarum]|uniref:Uncharacterized protein n=1 Tax=Mycolicibacterium cyprinidarum TaxID=2860311 RepID=A0ABQ4V6K4_9MYCO|nr:hypothetical protein NGTWS1702_34320 [Mycolicibacterium sp. NGTWSNA01]GJF18467.1 hypothetical protein NGTWS0302_16680 [Mycolicibacterium sp. NGTWS0302]
MNLEDELRDAIALRNEMAVELAVSLLRLATDYGLDPYEPGDRIVGGNYSRVTTDIEALTAVILQRCGISWDTMAARADVSRQALHRRLSARGEELFDDAIYKLKAPRTYDKERLIDALRKAEGIEDEFERDQALRLLPTKTRHLIELLVTMPSPEEILGAPNLLAAQLVELRQIPRWWDWRWDWDSDEQE